MTAPPKVCPICGSRYGFAATFCQKDGAQLTAEGSPDPFVGKTLLGQFRIEEPIGAGGMGTVYRAHQTTLSRNVAVKILHPELASNPDAVRRFHREAKVATQLEHPNLVRVFLFGELPNEEGLYLIMEYLEGKSITDVLKTEGALPVPRALHLAAQVCEGVGVAHAQGIVHRDVKPENIMVVQRHGDADFVKVLDFGIARLLWDEQSALTQSGVIFGTARYISPEGASGEHTDARSDVYSIGVLVYQLLTGVTPFEAQTPVAMLMKHIHDRPAPLRTVGKGHQVPQPVADAVMQALNKKPGHRYADATAFADALRSAASAAGVPMLGLRQSWSARTSLPPITPAPVPASTTTAPSPVSNTTDMSVAGLPKRPRWTTMLAAFVFGAAAVVSGVVAVDQFSGPSPAEQHEALVDRAREALTAGHIDAPPGENVLELSGRILEADPQHAGAKNVRREAVLRLFEEAARARALDDTETAKAALERVLVFQPGDPEALDVLASLDVHEHTEEAIGLQVTPEQPAIGESIAFLAVVDANDAVSRPAFEIWSGRRRLRRLPAVNAHDTHWVTSYTFRSAGNYEVRFVGDGIDDSFREAISVTRRGRGVARRTPRRQHTPQPFVQPQPQPQPPVMTTDDNGIDWTVPGTHSMQNPPSMEPAVDDHVPAPWTGTSNSGAVL